MIKLASIRRHTYPYFFMLVIMLMNAFAIQSSTAAASVIGAPLMAYNDNLSTENMDPYALIGSDIDRDSFYNEYKRLEQECASFSVYDIMTKASHSFVNRKNMERGAMLFLIAISRYDDSLDEKEKLNCAIAYANLSYYLIFERNNPIQAYPLTVKGLEIADKLDFKDKEMYDHTINTIVAIYTNIAKIFSVCRDFPRALHYYSHAYRIAGENNNPIALPMAFTDMLHCGWTLDSIQYIKRQIAEFDTLKVPNSANRFMYDYAKAMAKGAGKYSEKRYGEALALVDSASKTLDPYVDDRRYFVTNRIIAGKIAMDNKDYIKAGETLHGVDSLIKTEKLEDLYDLVYNLQYSLNLAMGRQDEAQKYRIEGLLIRDSLNQMHSYSILRNMELSLQTKGLNDMLSDSRKETQRWIYITVGAIVLILIICVLVVRILIKNRHLKEQSESLFNKNIELMTLEAPKTQIPMECAEVDTEETTTDEQNGCPRETPSDNDEDSSETYRRVLEYMASSTDIFSPTFTVETLAESLGYKLKPVSQAINSVGGKNFNTLLAEFRIKKACERMLQSPDDPALRPTIEALAEEVGYKSRTHFMRVFKSVTGLTTTEFLQQATVKKA